MNAQDLSALLDRVRQQDGGRIAWIKIRDNDAVVVAAAGPTYDPVFPMEFVRSQLRSRQPVFKTLGTEAGEVLVEAFPFRLPAGMLPAAVRVPEQSPPAPPRDLGIIEIAVPLNGDTKVFWPLRRSLLINCSAVFALLLSLTVMGVRFRSYVEGKQLEQLVEVARRVQQDLLGSHKQLPDRFRLAADYVPAAKVGGDFYDVFPVNGHDAAFVLGDVSGKGIPAALLMGVIHGAVRSSAWTDSPWSLEESTRNLNSLLCESTSQERFATMFWSYYDSQTEFLHYVNAGHFPPFLFRKGGQTSIRLSDGGPVLGLLPDAQFERGAIRFEPGDVLVLYSDGVVESENPSGEQFGLDRLAAVVESIQHDAADQIRDRILASVREFTGGAPPEDDRTLVVVRYQDVGIQAAEEADVEAELVALAA